MKKLIILLFPIFAFGQDIEIFKNNEFGVPQVIPSFKIENNQIFEFNEFGVQQIQPKFLLKEDVVLPNTLYLYKVNEYGVREVQPTYTIKNLEIEQREIDINILLNLKNERRNRQNN